MTSLAWNDPCSREELYTREANRDLEVTVSLMLPRVGSFLPCRE